MLREVLGSVATKLNALFADIDDRLVGNSYPTQQLPELKPIKEHKYTPINFENAPYEDREIAGRILEADEVKSALELPEQFKSKIIEILAKASAILGIYQSVIPYVVVEDMENFFRPARYNAKTNVIELNSVYLKAFNIAVARNDKAIVDDILLLLEIQLSHELYHARQLLFFPNMLAARYAKYTRGGADAYTAPDLEKEKEDIIKDESIPSAGYSLDELSTMLNTTLDKEIYHEQLLEKGPNLFANKYVAFTRDLEINENIVNKLHWAICKYVFLN